MSAIKEFKGSLIPILNDKSSWIDASEEEQTENYSNLPIDKIKQREDQPREKFDESSLIELQKSIENNGVIQPIIVQPIQDGFYKIIAGERRWRAAQKADLKIIPAIIKNYEIKEQMLVSLIENIQRENLNPIEEALAIKKLIDNYSITHQQVADNLGKSRSSISNLLRLLDLQEDVKQMLIENKIEVGHAKILVPLTFEHQTNIANMIVNKNLTVRDAEKVIQNLTRENSKLIVDKNLYKDKINIWSNRLSKLLHSKIDIKLNQKGQGRLMIQFSTPGEIEWLVDKIEYVLSNEINNNIR